ncbi:MAG: hypothetical protein DRJ97_00310 [Thermoprotei archaeon]|nr:MAG: hypothetical protein DRJ97_00310 [Thermoprotei archaeon]
MSKFFLDARLRVLTSEALSLARHLKWRGVALAVDELNLNLAKELANEGRKLKIDVAIRLDVHVESSSKLKQTLTKNRRKVEFVGVVPLTIEVARVAARDSRVDFLVLQPDPRVKVFDEGVASLMRSSGVILEMDLAPLIIRGCCSPLLRHYRKAYELAKKRGLNVVFASGAEELMHMRAPRDLAALAALITMDEEEARRMLSEVPKHRLDLNRSKLSPNYVMPGVRVVEPKSG